MLLSRFWYVVLAIALGGCLYGLFLATSMYDRASTRAMGEALSGDSQVVASYLRDDARKRAIALMVPAFDEDIHANLAKSSASPEKVPTDAKDKIKLALRKQFNAVPAELKFDAMFAVDQAGRVVAQVGFDQASGIDSFELGGYPIVADALHGWVRDDSWILGDRIYRIVARPVEHDTSAMPAGAIVGAKVIDDLFARELSRRTGAAVGFYANGRRVSSGCPDSFDSANLDTITSDLRGLDGDPLYKERGVSDVRTVHGALGVVYARLPGEAWDLGAGYAVARTARLVQTPLGFFKQADDKDKAIGSSAVLLVAILAFAAGLVGIGFSVLEHTRPIQVFRREAALLAKGQIDQLAPSRFRGVFRKIASDLNDGADRVAAKGGVPRKAADLQQVLGPMPAQPAMSAFSLPNDQQGTPVSARGGPTAPSPAAPAPAPMPVAPAPAPMPVAPAPASAPLAPSPGAAAPAARLAKPVAPPPSPVKAAPPQPPAPPPATSLAPDEGDDEATVVSHVPSELLMHPGGTVMDEAMEWRLVFEEYLRIRRQCGEPVDGITFEKFQNTLRKNREQLVQRHGCKAVKFSVYVKDGRAAIKANPVRE